MTRSQEAQLINAYDRLYKGGGSISMGGEASTDSAALVANLASMDTDSVARLIQDLNSVIVIMESSTIGWQHKPKHKPHVNIKLDSDGSYDNMGTKWH